MRALARLLQPRHRALKVTEGPVDAGRWIWLTGDRLVIGADRGADLRLDGLGILPRHLTLIRQTPPKSLFGWLRDTGKVAWVFSFEDDPQNRLNGAAAPRSGPVGDDTTFGLGGDTTLAVVRAPVTAAAPPAVQDAVRTLPFPIDDYGAYYVLFLATIVLALVGICVAVLNTTTDRPETGSRILLIDRLYNPERQDQTMRQIFAEELAACASSTPGLAAAAEEQALHAYLLNRQGDAAAAATELRRLDSRFGQADCPARNRVRCDMAQILTPGGAATDSHCKNEGTP